ncbi:MAG: hypothetical protein JSU82_17605 [Rhodospirillales bacterium]|nr:MAG: hypothetical protein JSU82_17605 [Rhodospirillales bacterium]
MRKILIINLFLPAILLTGGPARADGFAIGAGISTMGYGIHAATEVNSFLALRVNGNFGDFTIPDYGLLSSSLGGLDYDIDARMKSIGLLADLHPLGLSPIGGGFVLTGGVFYNQNEFDFSAVSGAGDTIGGVPIPAGTSVIANMTFDREFAPYAGLGYDGTFQGALPISFFLTAGVLFQGGPSVALTESSGTVPQANLDAEARQIEEDAQDFEYYPVVAIGLTISF